MEVFTTQLTLSVLPDAGNAGSIVGVACVIGIVLLCVVIIIIAGVLRVYCKRKRGRHKFTLTYYGETFTSYSFTSIEEKYKVSDIIIII